MGLWGKRSSSAPELLPRVLTTFLLTLALAGRMTHAIQQFGSVEASEEDEKTNERETDEYEDEDDPHDEDDEDEYEDDDDFDYEEEWKDPINVTSEESYVLSNVADFMSNVHTLLWDVDINKDHREAEKELEKTWKQVKRDAVTVSAATALFPGDRDAVISCVAQAQKEAELELQLLQETLLECYIKEQVKFDPSNASLDDEDEVDDGDDAEAVRRAAAEFLDFALNVMRATRLEGALETVQVATQHPHGAPALVHHAEMLQRRGLRRRETIRRCVDITKEDAYKKADAAREVLAQCLLLLAMPPLGVDPKDEL